jgi:hypothetical protein
MCRWGWILGNRGYGRACMMLRCHGWGCKPPLTASHIHIGYTKCLSTLRCWGSWAYWYTLKSYYICSMQVGVNFRENGVWPSLYDVLVSWLRLQTPIDCIPHPYWACANCFSTLRCCGWACYAYSIHGVIPSTLLWIWCQWVWRWRYAI